MVISSLHHRYVSGHHREVWAELIAAGRSAFDGRLRSDASAVAEEFVARSLRNLQLIHQRLGDLGYAFAHPDQALQIATAADTEQLGRLDAEVGPLPVVARAWYGTVSSLDFSQRQDQLWHKWNPAGPNPPPAPPIFGLGSHCVLLRRSLEEAHVERLQPLPPTDIAEQIPVGQTAADQRWANWRSGAKASVRLGGDASNCEPKEIILPGTSFDPIIYDDGGTVPGRFGEEIRRAFDWGGFPFWGRLLRDPEWYSPCNYRPQFATILPLLKADLLPV